MAKFTLAFRPSMIGFGSLHALSAAGLSPIITCGANQIPSSCHYYRCYIIRREPARRIPGEKGDFLGARTYIHLMQNIIYVYRWRASRGDRRGSRIAGHGGGGRAGGSKVRRVKLNYVSRAKARAARI